MRTFVRALVVIGSVAAAAVTQGAARADSPPGATASPSGTPSAKPPAAPSAAAQPPAAAPAQNAASEKNGIVQIVDEAMAGIHLRPEQQTALQQLGGEADKKVAAVDQAKRTFLIALAEQLDENKIDAKGLKSEIQQFVDAADAASPVLRSDLEKIHGILDPDQRKDFAKAFRDALKKREAMIDPKKHLEKWAKTLKLTDDQKKKIGDILSEDAPMNDVARDRIDLVLDAFPESTFSMNDLLPPSSVKDRAEEMAKYIVYVTNQVAQVLTPEQRTLAAKHLREKASGQATGTTTSAESLGEDDAVGSSSQGLWTGAGASYGAARSASYRSYSGYGFGGGYATGFGGTYLL